MSDNFDDIVQRQQAVTLDLRVDVLTLSAEGQQLYQVGVIEQEAVRVNPVAI